jgi:hypothetical protein
MDTKISKTSNYADCSDNLTCHINVTPNIQRNQQPSGKEIQNRMAAYFLYVKSTLQNAKNTHQNVNKTL